MNVEQKMMNFFSVKSMLSAVAGASVVSLSLLAAVPAQAAHARMVVNGEVSAARQQALKECSALEKRFPQNTWGVQEIEIYAACMARFNQVE